MIISVAPFGEICLLSVDSNHFAFQIRISFSYEIDQDVFCDLYRYHVQIHIPY